VTMAKRKQPTAKTGADRRPAAEEYTVLARRYRPQQFADIVGQEPIARALVNALESNRVAHAYLFTGARGVGKTSTARILAKALNCARGPTTKPCDACENCQSIALGEDIDVLEIDGASNRGIDEVRQIRQTLQSRPAKSRYKIYIIDEVHMLTPPAFNALLKTLEEPPSHVKFIFATTEVQRIPITILSRCQRFDFAGIDVARITGQLRQILASEQLQADDEALEIIARRAAGSMRDAESLLDQLLAFGGTAAEGRLTVTQVHQLLGTAHADRVVALASAALERDAKQALDLLGNAADEGLQLGELVDQLIDYWRDLMVVRCAGGDARNLSVPSANRGSLAAQASSLNLDTILAGLDILSATKSRLRGNSHSRVLVEMALIRLARLEDLLSVADLVRQLGEAQPRSARVIAPGPQPPPSNRPATAKASVPPVAPIEESEKKNRAGPVEQGKTAGPLALTEATLPGIWQELIGQMGPILGGNLQKAVLPAIIAPKTLVLRFEARYNHQQEHCKGRSERLEEALRKLTGEAWNVRIESVSNEAAALPAPAAEAEKSQTRYRRQRTEAMQQPLVKRASEMLGAQIVQLDDGFGSAPVEAVESRPEDAQEE
jgi:DNA polymerase-3 subunit gamma/tau